MFPINAANVLQKLWWLEENEITFREKFSFEHALIYEPDRIRLVDSFQVKVLFNLLLTLPFERQNRKIEKNCMF